MASAAAQSAALALLRRGLVGEALKAADARAEAAGAEDREAARELAMVEATVVRPSPPLDESVASRLELEGLDAMAAVRWGGLSLPGAGAALLAHDREFAWSWQQGSGAPRLLALLDSACVVEMDLGAGRRSEWPVPLPIPSEASSRTSMSQHGQVVMVQVGMHVYVVDAASGDWVRTDLAAPLAGGTQHRKQCRVLSDGLTVFADVRLRQQGSDQSTDYIVTTDTSSGRTTQLSSRALLPERLRGTGDVMALQVTAAPCGEPRVAFVLEAAWHAWARIRVVDYSGAAPRVVCEMEMPPRAWDSKTGHLAVTLKEDCERNALQWSSDGRRLVFCAMQNYNMWNNRDEETGEALDPNKIVLGVYDAETGAALPGTERVRELLTDRSLNVWDEAGPRAALSDRLLAVAAGGPAVRYFDVRTMREWFPACRDEYDYDARDARWAAEEEFYGYGNDGEKDQGTDDVAAAFARGHVFDPTDYEDKALEWSPCGGLLAMHVRGFRFQDRTRCYDEYLRVFDPFSEPAEVAEACAAALWGGGLADRDAAALVCAYVRRTVGDTYA